jgi:S-adenosylmethionine uptake transporter
MPLAKVIALSFVAPLLIPFAAWAVLGERPRLSNLLAGGVGFAGAWLAVGAGAGRIQEAEMLGAGAVLLSAVLYALSIAILRQRAERDGPAIVGFLQTLIPCAILAGPALAFGKPPAPEALPAFILMGLLGAAGWYALITAYARAEAQTLAPMEFTALAWAVLLGLFFFQETPALQTLLGAAVIMAACLLAAWDEQRVARTAAKAGP